MLEMCEEQGLVHVAENKQGVGHVICNCCSDCCINWTSMRTGVGKFASPQPLPRRDRYRRVQRMREVHRPMLLRCPAYGRGRHAGHGRPGEVHGLRRVPPVCPRTPSLCRWSGPRSSFPRNEPQSRFGAVAAYPKARMHELQITERILDVVLKHAAGQDVSKVVRIHLRIGALSDLEDEWIQHYFDYLSRGTVAENAQLAITRTGRRVLSVVLLLLRSQAGRVGARTLSRLRRDGFGIGHRP